MRLSELKDLTAIMAQAYNLTWHLEVTGDGYEIRFINANPKYYGVVIIEPSRMLQSDVQFQIREEMENLLDSMLEGIEELKGQQ